MRYITRVDERSIDLRDARAQPHPTDMFGGLVAGLSFGQPRLVTGIVMGPVNVEVQRCDKTPETVADGWEDIVEFSCRSDVADVYAAGPYADTPAPDAALIPAGSHWFRVRAHARGRDLEYDLVASVPREEYLLLCWPAAPSDPSAIAAASSTARTYLASSPSTPNGEGATVTATPPASRAETERQRRQRENLLRITRERRQH